MEAKDTVRFLPNEYRECADEDGVMRKYKVSVHEPSFKAGIKEVVEDMVETFDTAPHNKTMASMWRCIQKWQAKL